MKVLVTGGNGFLGRRLRLFAPDWIYPTSNEMDLMNPASVMSALLNYNPDAVVHLAAKVGGIKANFEAPAEFFYKNMQMNLILIQCCHIAGIKRVLSSLSTCAFPDIVDEYPFLEWDILEGPPGKTNLAYGFTKRALYIQSKAYSKQYGLNYNCFSPSNLYGPGDNFDLETSHFVPACIRKFCEAPTGIVKLWGTGEPLRQQLYVDDLASIIPDLLKDHTTNDPIIIAPKENLSIKHMAEVCKKVTGSKAEVEFTGELDGQFRKDGYNGKFMGLYPDFKFTPFEEGVKKAYEWYIR